MEGAAHMMLVLGRFSCGVLLNAPATFFSDDLPQWSVTLADLVYIPLLGLSEIDFYAKVVVNAFLAIGLALSGRRAGLL